MGILVVWCSTVQKQMVSTAASLEKVEENKILWVEEQDTYVNHNNFPLKYC